MDVPKENSFIVFIRLLQFYSLSCFVLLKFT
eukprot:UN09023